MERNIDLDRIPRDIEYIKRMFKGFGDNDPEKSWINIDSSRKELLKTSEEILEKSMWLTDYKIPHILMCYYGG